ncbi:MAG: arylsulfatase [Bacteroidales bacterium]|jgi:arylsulfatase A-like enzyme|nr:arylsulfatase [Bacteroidales bacterium]
MHLKTPSLRIINRKSTAAMLAACALASCSVTDKNNELPNIVFILADDLGYGDLSCYGQQKFQTPNIDRLAQDGMLFRHHYAGCTVSAPSRSSLMTGQHTGHTPVRGNKEWHPEGQWPLPAKSLTIAEMLKSKNYSTGAFGKWGLGFIGTEGDPNAQGFDEFFGFNCQRLAHNYYPYYLWHNKEKILLEENSGTAKGTYSPDVIHEAALRFIEDNSNKPFFLFYPSIIPHAELFAKEEYIKAFRGKFNPERSYEGTDDGPGYKQGAYGSQPESHAAFAAMVTQLDDYVGEIISRLKELGLEKNTIVIFSSDNGPHLEGGADPDYFNSNGGLRGYKRDLYEGGIRAPFIVKWPGKIKTGSSTDHISAFWDIMPTLAEITGTEIPCETDGISFLSTLTGNSAEQEQHDYLYWEFHEQGGKAAVLKGDWKAIKTGINSTGEKNIELYNLRNDPGEDNNLADSWPEIITNMETIMEEAHISSDVFPFVSESEEKK